MLRPKYNPDVLSCLANLSNDEVFTPPELANAMLNTLPQEIWQDENATFLDPCCKSGVFLREIAKRLIVGLKDKIPDEQERIDHVFKNQLYGISITEMTGMLSRRSVYCSKHANGKYSVCTKFTDESGNIIFNETKHVFKNGRCEFCGAAETEYGEKARVNLESHAYQFIHTLNAEEIFNMKFDVIIGNPPYHLSDGGAQASAKPIYHYFVNTAKKLNPRYLVMIIPARWMTGGKGLDDFRRETIHDRHFAVLHDFANAEDCFNGVDVKGGICYFLWDRDRESKCDIYRHDNNGIIYSKRYLVEDDDDIFIRYPQLVAIKNKVWKTKVKSFEEMVSSRKPYGLASDFFVNPLKFGLPLIYDNPIDNGYSILGLAALKRITKYIPNNYPLPKKDGLQKYKLFITNSYGCGEIGEGPATPVLATPGELCTETFLEIGPFENYDEAFNAMTYLKTKFFRCLVGIRKQTQHATKQVYHYVPMQDFTENSDILWGQSVSDVDKQLYKKYNLTQEEIQFIESMIRPME